MLWTPIWSVRLQRPCLGHQRRLAAVAAVAPTGLLADVWAAALPPGCSQSGQTVTCTYAPGQISRSRCQRACPLDPRRGSRRPGRPWRQRSNSRASRGSGAAVSGDLHVTAGSTLYAVVGHQRGRLRPPWADRGRREWRERV